MKQKLLILFSFIALGLLSGTSIIAQTNTPSKQTGISFQWSNLQPTTFDSASLGSISVNGSLYNNPIVASGYTLTQLGPAGASVNNVLRNGVAIETSSASGTWNVSALAAFRHLNLNHHFETNGNGQNFCDDFVAESTTSEQRQTFTYSPGFVSSTGRVLAVSERNANNCFHIEVFGTPTGGGPAQSLGETFVNQTPTQWGYGGTGTNSTNHGTPGTVNPPGSGTDYWQSDWLIENGGTIGIVLFYLNNIAPLGSTITSIGLTASTFDHGDGKLLVFRNTNTLPVKIISFTATQQNSNSLLNWKVAAELNVKAYQILHSNDGVNYNQAGIVPAVSSSNYDFVHRGSDKSTNYYHFLAVDMDGNQQYNETRLVRFDNSGTVSVFPNPATDEVNIYLTVQWQNT